MAQKIMTLMLLRNIFVNMFTWLLKLTSTTLPFIALMVLVWLSKSVLTVVAGRTVYHKTHAKVIPTNKYMKKLSALPCSLRSAFSFRSVRSFSSSSFMVLYMRGTAAIAAKKTKIMLA